MNKTYNQTTNTLLFGKHLGVVFYGHRKGYDRNERMTNDIGWIDGLNYVLYERPQVNRKQGDNGRET